MRIMPRWVGGIVNLFYQVNFYRRIVVYHGCG